ncbi:MAG: helix-turn-helix domain-containing protein [Armatimonadetes bacterium]|nr:helix-turn-helix domain-containing protein [Armatimonadota bacterium]
MRNADSSEETRALGARVTGARTAKGVSVAQLAELAGVSKAYMHQIENGECKRPSAQVMFDIANVLGTSVGYLLGRTPDTPEPGKVRIPASLRRFAELHQEIGKEDVEMLARIRHRGDQPKTEKDWEYLWESIKRSVR